MKSLIKLKINHKVESGQVIPWDLIYLINKEDIEMSKRLFKYNLIVKDDKVVKTLLGNLLFETMEVHGLIRDERLSSKIKGDATLDSLMNLKDYALLVPILTRGNKAGKKALRYFSSKVYRRAIKVGSKNPSIKKGSHKEMPSVIISAGDELEGMPCTNCIHLHKKILDEFSCTLGSAECLSSILIGKGSDFNSSLLPIKRGES